MFIDGKFSNWIQAVWSTSTHVLFWLNRMVGIKLIDHLVVNVLCFCKFYFGDPRQVVDSLLYICHMLSFSYNAKKSKECRFFLLMFIEQWLDSNFCVTCRRDIYWGGRDISLNNLLIEEKKFRWFIFGTNESVKIINLRIKIKKKL